MTGAATDVDDGAVTGGLGGAWDTGKDPFLVGCQRGVSDRA